MSASSFLAASAGAWGVAAARLAQESPTPMPQQEMTIYTVTPGISGFIAFFALAVAAWLLFRSMTKHVRRVDQRARMESAPPADAGSAGAVAEDAQGDAGEASDARDRARPATP